MGDADTDRAEARDTVGIFGFTGHPRPTNRGQTPFFRNKLDMREAPFTPPLGTCCFKPKGKMELGLAARQPQQ